MNNLTKVGSNLRLQAVELDPVQGAPTGKPPAAGEAGTRALGLASFSTTFQWRGNGRSNLNCRHGWINAGSRVFASVSEYNTAWNVDRFVGLAPIAVLNVSPYNGGCVVWLNVSWSGPINVCVSLLVDP